MRKFITSIAVIAMAAAMMTGCGSADKKTNSLICKYINRVGGKQIVSFLLFYSIVSLYLFTEVHRRTVIHHINSHKKSYMSIVVPAVPVTVIFLCSSLTFGRLLIIYVKEMSSFHLCGTA